MPAAIEVRGLTKVFYPARSLGSWLRAPWHPGVPIEALKDVSLTVEPGQLVCLMGSNGAGKTTLLKALLGLILPTSGDVLINGHPVSRSGRGLRASLGFVSSDRPGFYDRLTGRQNLLFFAALQGLSRREAQLRVQQALEALTVERPDRQYQEYSAGLKQRLLLARGLLHQPRILVLDEPTKSLDPMQAGLFREFVTRLHGATGTTMLWTTHQLQEAEQLAGRLVILHEGTVRFSGPREQLGHSGDLAAAMGRLCR